ncbi:MAG: hypothetical protein RBS17_05145 [Coriobacteriia bacterium]|nr:hypothetical protein [Coriobacteriia bacterium]
MDEHNVTIGHLEDGITPPAAPELPDRTARGSRGCSGIVLGVFLVLIGIPMLVCPGPGMAVILSGLGMIGVGLGIKNAGV